MIITVFSSKTLVSFRLWLYCVWCIWLWPTYLLGFDLCRFGFNACLFGFDSCLFRFNSCLFDFDSNICFRLYLPVSGDCPKLQSIPLARPSYRWCTTESQAVNHTWCALLVTRWKVIQSGCLSNLCARQMELGVEKDTNVWVSRLLSNEPALAR